MKRLLLFVVLTVSFVTISYAWPRLGRGSSPTFHDTGNAAIGFSVAIGTTTKVQLYSVSYSPLNSSDIRDREIMVQQNTSFNLYCSTSSTGWTASSGNRWVVYSSQTFVTSGLSNMWCLFEPGAGSGTKEVIGRISYDLRD